MKTIKTTAMLGILILLTTNFFSFKNKNQEKLLTGTGEIKGKVTDKTSGEEIAFATVILKDKSGSQVSGAATGATGFYSFQKISSGEYSITVSYIGYKTQHVKNIIVGEGKTTTINIGMEADPAKLSEVTIEKQDELLIENEEIRGLPAHEVNNVYYKKKAGESRIMSPAKAGNIAGGYAFQYTPTVFNTEQYDYISENEFRHAKDEPLSTFSIDVDRASYSNIRRFINNGQTPPADAVRIEEMINYFSYNYPQPEGEHPFSISTEISECPWNSKHKLVQIGLQGKKINTDKLPPSNLVFLIDVSGSMSDYNKLPLVKQSLRLLVNQLREQDKVAMVVYAGAAGLVLEPTPGNNKEKILSAIEKLESGGSTAGGAGIKLAYEVAKEHFMKEGNNRVILATDGDFNVGASSDGELVRLIEEKRETGIFLTVLGYGMGNYKDSKMEKLADKGNGNYAYMDNIMEAKKTLVNEMGGTLMTIAKDVKIQVEFNPAKVASYKLIGYENRLLNKEDFNDDTKDAGELGSGHTVTALYEIALAGSEEVNSKVDPLRYQKQTEIKTPESNLNEEILTVKFRYKEPQGKESKLIEKNLRENGRELALASNNYKFSVAVAEFGLLLRNSKFKGNASYEEVIKLAKMGKGEDPEGYRTEFIRLVELYELQAKK